MNLYTSWFHLQLNHCDRKMCIRRYIIIGMYIKMLKYFSGLHINCIFSLEQQLYLDVSMSFAIFYSGEVHVHSWIHNSFFPSSPPHHQPAFTYSKYSIKLSCFTKKIKDLLLHLKSKDLYEMIYLKINF